MICNLEGSRGVLDVGGSRCVRNAYEVIDISLVGILFLQWRNY